MRKSKQEKRSEEARAISVAMKRLMTGYRTLLEAALEDEGITLAQLRMLHALDEHPEMSAADLARTCFITPQSMQAQVKRAEKEQWIVRKPSAANRRVLSATLTPAGRRVLQSGQTLSLSIENDIWGGARLGELESMHAALDGAIARLQPSLDLFHARSAARRKPA